MALQRRNNNVVRLDDETMEMLKDKAGKEKIEIFIKRMVKIHEKGTKKDLVLIFLLTFMENY